MEKQSQSINYPLKCGIEIEGTTPLQQWQLEKHLKDNGVEIILEAHSFNSRSPKTWILSTDGSIRDLAKGKAKGDELISPPLTGDMISKEITRMAYLLGKTVLGDKHLKVNKYCSLHVHMDISTLTKEQLKYVYEYYQLLESSLHRMFPPSRTHNLLKEDEDGNKTSYCKSIKGLSFEKAFSERPKYYSVRFSTSVPTIEFRIHQGTRSSRKILYWIRLLHFLINRALQLCETKVDISTLNPKLHLEYILEKTGLKNYYEERAEKFDKAREKEGLKL